MEPFDILTRSLAKKTPDHLSVVGHPDDRRKALGDLPSYFMGTVAYSGVMYWGLISESKFDFAVELARRIRHSIHHSEAVPLEDIVKDLLDGDRYLLSLAAKELAERSRKVLIILDGADLLFVEGNRRTLEYLRHLSERGSFVFVLGSNMTIPWDLLNTFNPIPIKV